MTMRPIKYVEAGGGRFVAALNKPFTYDYYASVLYNEIESPESASGWRNVYSVADPYPLTTMRCGAFGPDAGAKPSIPGKPTFCFGGDAYDTADQLQKIITSHDGVSWSEALRGPSNFIYAMGWDFGKKRFYAQAVANGYGSIDVLESADGHGWSVVESVAMPDPDQIYASPLLQATGTPLIKDEDGNIVPNGGWFGWDFEANIWIKPVDIIGPYRWYNRDIDFSGRSGSVEIIQKIINPETGAERIERVTRPTPIANVAYATLADGICHAAGYSDSENPAMGYSIASSADYGKTWHIDATYPDESIALLVGAPSSVF